WTRRFRSTKKDREAPARSAQHRRSAQAFLLWQKLQAAARSARWIREKVHQPEDCRTVRTCWHQFGGTKYLIKNKSTASGGETPKGSAVSGVHLSHRDLGHMNGTSFGRRLWDCGTRVSAARLDEYPSRRCIHE